MARKKEAAESIGVRESKVTRPTWSKGNRGTRRERIPRKRVTVWAGTSWLKATRKEIWRGIVPAMGVNLLADRTSVSGFFFQTDSSIRETRVHTSTSRRA